LEISRHSEAEISILAIIIVSAVSLPRKHREWPERLLQASVGAFDGLILLPAATAHISSDEIDPPGSCAKSFINLVALRLRDAGQPLLSASAGRLAARNGEGKDSSD
jgi:hypothetical protein